MDIEQLRSYCLSFPGTEEDVKWGNDLCFLVAKKMFCVTSLDGTGGTSFKVTDEEFEELSSRDKFVPAPYMARHKWLLVKNHSKLSQKEWKHFVKQSYELIKARLSKKTKLEWNLPV